MMFGALVSLSVVGCVAAEGAPEADEPAEAVGEAASAVSMYPPGHGRTSEILEFSSVIDARRTVQRSAAPNPQPRPLHAVQVSVEVPAR